MTTLVIHEGLQMAGSKQVLGKQGEAIARTYLLERGYKIIMTNWHCRYGELDIIAKEGRTWVFVEVKTHRGISTEQAFLAIHQKKRDRLLRTVHAYLDEHNLDDEIWRVDAIGIAIAPHKQTKVDHVEDALDW